VVGRRGTAVEVRKGGESRRVGEATNANVASSSERLPSVSLVIRRDTADAWLANTETGRRPLRTWTRRVVCKERRCPSDERLRVRIGACVRRLAVAIWSGCRRADCSPNLESDFAFPPTMYVCVSLVRGLSVLLLLMMIR
jgi:hypothetical protein